MMNSGKLASNPLKDHVAAVSCGIIGGTLVLDLDYAEDSAAETDANFVATGKGGIVEVQATAEGEPFAETAFLEMLQLAKTGIARLISLQQAAVC
jgi:ribonuclease PH